MGRWGGYGRRTVEQTRAIDVNTLRRAGYIGKVPGNWWVYREAMYRAGVCPKHWSDDAVTMETQTLPITYVPWHFGGRRAYLLCGCGRMVGKLYAPRGLPWRCRRCYGLTYATRQAAPHDRLLLKAQKIRERLGGDPNDLGEFPPKPKGMHWRRYNRLQRLHDQADQSSLALAAVRIFRLSVRLKSRA